MSLYFSSSLANSSWLVSPENQTPKDHTSIICIVTIYCIPHSVLDKIKRMFPSLALTLLAARVLCNYVYLLFFVFVFNPIWLLYLIHSLFLSHSVARSFPAICAVVGSCCCCCCFCIRVFVEACVNLMVQLW